MRPASTSSARPSAATSFGWSVSGGGTIGSSGLFRAGSTGGGPFTVTVASGALTGTASVSVTAAPPVLATISVAPASASVPAGGKQQFTATGLDQFGQALIPQPSFGWSVSGGGTIDASGLFHAGSTAGGPFSVTAAERQRDRHRQRVGDGRPAGPDHDQRRPGQCLGRGRRPAAVHGVRPRPVRPDHIA